MNKQAHICVMENLEGIDVPMPTFFVNQYDPLPKKVLPKI